MKRYKILLIISLVFVPTFNIFSQSTFSDFIKAAGETSYAAKLTRNEFRLAELSYSLFKSGYKPILSLYGNAPVYNKDNFDVRQPDGSIKFLERSQNMSNVGFSFTQLIAATGGSVSLNTDLYRFDDFVEKTKQYNGTPVFLKLSQPIFSFNKAKWDKQIEPIRLKEAGMLKNVSLQEISFEVCRLYFDVVSAQAEQRLAETNLANSSANLIIETRRFQAGISSEDKILQLEIQQISGNQQLATANMERQKALLSLYSYSNLEDTTSRKLDLPETIPIITKSPEEIIQLARQNLPLYSTFERKQLEAKQNIQRARVEGRRVEVVASYGLNNAADNIGAIYRSPNDQQRFSLGFSIPIFDWGKTSKSIERAKLEAEKVGISNKAEEARFISDMTGEINLLRVTRDNISQLLKIDSISNRRYAITNRLYQSGKASLLDLQAAQSEKDNSRRQYIYSLRLFWETYYSLRMKTIEDFVSW